MIESNRTESVVNIDKDEFPLICSHCQAKRYEENQKFNSLSRLEMKTAISRHYRTKTSIAPKRKRGYASCECKKYLPQGRHSAFHLLFKVSRIEDIEHEHSNTSWLRLRQAAKCIQA